MSLELVYTSALRGLKPNSSGFCTVAATGGMSKPVMMRLESLSGYEFHYRISDPKVDLNPVNYAHTQINAGHGVRSVLSRVSYCGTDYSNRINKIAHHFLLGPGEQLLQGPAWMMAQMAETAFQCEWRDQPGELPPRSIGDMLLRSSGPEPKGAQYWQELTGDPGWAGMLAKAFQDSKRVPAFVIFENDTRRVDVLRLFEESLGLLPSADRWELCFATYYTSLPAGCQYHWRGVVAGSSAANEIMRFPGAQVIDLTKPLPKAEDNEYTRAAREGRSVEEARVELKPSIGLAAQEKREEEDLEKQARELVETTFARRARESQRPIRFKDQASPRPRPRPTVSARTRRQRPSPAPFLVAASAVLVIAGALAVGLLWNGRDETSASLAKGHSGTTSAAGTSPAAAQSSKRTTDGPKPKRTFTQVMKELEEGGIESPDTELMEEAEALAKTPEEGTRWQGFRNRVNALNAEKKDFDDRYEKLNTAYPTVMGYLKDARAKKFVDDADKCVRLGRQLSKCPDVAEPYRKQVGKFLAKINQWKQAVRDRIAEVKEPPRGPRSREELRKTEPKLVFRPVRSEGKHAHTFRFDVQQATRFIQFPSKIRYFEGDSVVLMLGPNKQKLVARYGQYALAGTPLFTCYLNRRRRPTQLVCEMDKNAKRDQYRKIIDSLVLEVIDQEEKPPVVYQCPLIPRKDLATVTARIGFDSKGHSGTPANIAIPYFWPTLLQVRWVRGAGQTDLIDWNPERGRWETTWGKGNAEVHIKLERVPANEDEFVLKVSSNTVSLVAEQARDVNRRLTRKEAEKTGLQGQIEKERKELGKRPKNKDQIAEWEKRNEKFKKKEKGLKSKTHAVEKEIKRTEEKFGPIKQRLEAAKRTYDKNCNFEVVLSPWNLPLKKIEARFGICDPRKIK